MQKNYKLFEIKKKIVNEQYNFLCDVELFEKYIYS